MKASKLIFPLLFSLSMIFSCASQIDFYPEVFSVSGLDLLKYTKQNFLFTTDIYRGDYDAVSILSVSHTPKAVLKYATEGTRKYWSIEELNTCTVLDKLYNSAVKLGADAIMQLETEKSVVIMCPRCEHSVSLPVITISGFAIKRKGGFK